MGRILLTAIIGTAILTAVPALPADNPARIYIFADWDSPTHSWVPVTCDGVIVAKVKNGRFFALNVTPGRHTLIVQDSVPIFIEARAGEESFVQIEQQVELNPSGKSVIPVLHLVAPADARKEIINLAYIDAGKMVSPDVSREDPTPQWQPHLKKRSN